MLKKNSVIKEKMQEKYKNLFTPQIIFRGRDYYTDERVGSLYKDNNKYIATVGGSHFDNEYNVEIIIEDDEIKMSCTCPCVGSCKHEYATLMAIDNEEYVNVKLLPIPEDGKVDVNKLINEIPESRIKDYLQNSFKNEKIISKEEFIDEFNNYLPEKSREYFYNTLCNNFQLGKSNLDLIEFIKLAKKSLENNKYEYSFTIISAIIDAAKGSNYNYDNEFLLNEYNKLAMFLRISYRKGNNKLKIKMDKWINKIVEENYYDDIYLEDMIITVKQK